MKLLEKLIAWCERRGAEANEIREERNRLAKIAILELQRSNELRDFNNAIRAVGADSPECDKIRVLYAQRDMIIQKQIEALKREDEKNPYLRIIGD